LQILLSAYYSKVTPGEAGLQRRIFWHCCNRFCNFSYVGFYWWGCKPLWSGCF